MSTILRRPDASSLERAHEPPDELHSGDRMTREEFHRAYMRAPKDFKAELIEGTVYVASPVSRRHGTLHLFLGSALPAYVCRTPGIEAGSETTAFLDESSEPQPDLSVRVLSEHGGRSRTTADGKFVIGPPELVIEIAYRSRSLDLHAKRGDYARAGVLEYAVWVVEENRFVRFDLSNGEELPVTDDEVLRSFSFPGLWLDQAAIRDLDYRRLIHAVEAGLATPEHAAFVKRLAEAKR